VRTAHREADFIKEGRGAEGPQLQRFEADELTI
jgi:hypothetical protein